jgi:hypothetical protein
MTVALVLATATARDRSAKAVGTGATAETGSAGHTGVAGNSGPAGDPAAAAGAVPVIPAAAKSPVRDGPSAAGTGAAESAVAGGAGGGPGGGAARMRAADSAGTASATLALPDLSGGQLAPQPLLAHLCGQLAALGMTDIVVITQAGQGDLMAAMAWEGLSHAGAWLGAAGNIEAIECASAGAELRTVAAVARRASGRGEPLLICAGDVVAHTEALARLHRSPATAALTAALTGAHGEPHLAAGPDARPALRLDGASEPYAIGHDAMRTGAGGPGADDGADGPAAHGVVAAAGSAFHRVHAPNAVGCGVFLVCAADAEALATAAGELAALAGDAPAIGAGPPAGGGPVPWPIGAGGSGFHDAVALLLVGLVRSGVPVAALDVRPLICLRVQTAEQVKSAAAQLRTVREDRVRLDSAVSRADGLFAICFVHPYSRHLARWAAGRLQSPRAVACMSAGLGLLAAVWFAAGSRAGMISGAVFLYGAFVLDRAGEQLARYARTWTGPGAWLGGVGGRLTELAVYAGLAAGAGATVARPRAVWELAVAAMIVQTVRDMIGQPPAPRRAAPPSRTGSSGRTGPPRLPLDEPADYAVSARGTDGWDADGLSPRRGRPRARARRLRRLRRAAAHGLVQLVEFQPGDRIAVIAVTAVVAGPVATFLVLIAWGLLATCMVVSRRIVRSFAC